MPPVPEDPAAADRDPVFSFISTIAGAAFVVFIVGFLYKRDAIHWEYLERVYGRPWRTPIRERSGSAVLYGKFPLSKAYNGIVKLGVHGDGLSLRIVFPLISLFCRPLFIPYRDICGWDQTWYLDAKTVELELAGAPEVKIVMPRKQVEWIRGAGRTDITMMNEASPHRDKPVIWHAFVITSSLVMIVGTIYVLLA